MVFQWGCNMGVLLFGTLFQPQRDVSGFRLQHILLLGGGFLQTLRRICRPTFGILG